MDRSITNTVDGAGGGCLNDNGRATLESISISNHGRVSPKAEGAIPKTPRRLWRFPLLGWAFSALIFTFAVNFEFRSGACSPRAFIANIIGDGEDQANFHSDPILGHDGMANNVAEVVDYIHGKQEKQGDLGVDLHGKQKNQEDLGDDLHGQQEKQHDLGDALHGQDEKQAGVGDELHGEQEKQQKDLVQQQQLSSDDSRVRKPSYCEHPEALSTVHLFDCAVHVGRENERKTLTLGVEAPPPRVAFLFLTRGELPMEPLWRRFFEGHEEFYSIYVHSHPDFSFKNDSFFYEHQVPSIATKRFSINLVDATKRLLASAILDPIHGTTNSWFVMACEATIPIHSFNFTFNYLMESQHSFVDSFKPRHETLEWFDFASEEAKPFSKEQLRKGEMWWAMKLRHALMVLEDWDIYYSYKRLCIWWSPPDEQYIPTLLGMKDPQGIENRTVHYVNWEDGHFSSPHTHEATDLTIDWFKDIQSRTIDKDGEYHDTSLDAVRSKNGRTSRSCYYNGVENSTCFLFARKVGAGAREHLESLPPSVLEY